MDQLGTGMGLPTGWTTRSPSEADVPDLCELRAAHQHPWTGSDRVDTEAIWSAVAGPASWTRRQLLAIDPAGRMRAWIRVNDRATGQTTVELYVDRTVSESADGADAAGVALPLYAWARAQAGGICRLRGVEFTELDATAFADDLEQRRWLSAAGYKHARSWLEMTRTVTPEDAEQGTPRAGVTVRRVATHASGLPVASDLQLVHRMLEESFADHFNSYRESFPEFVQRLRENPGHRWDHWWLAFATEHDEDPEGEGFPAGALVSSITLPDDGGVEGSYVDYIGVDRRARGRGVAKSLLFTVIAEAAKAGRNRVGLEVDAESPTGADQLYRSLGWSTDYVTESWLSPAVVTR